MDRLPNAYPKVEVIGPLSIWISFVNPLNTYCIDLSPLEEFQFLCCPFIEQLGAEALKLPAMLCLFTSFYNVLGKGGRTPLANTNLMRSVKGLHFCLGFLSVYLGLNLAL